MKYGKALLFLLLAYGCTLPVQAQESSESLANQTNNPLHPAASVAFQDYYTPELYNTDRHTNDFLLRATVPIAPGIIPVPQIMRISAPIATRPKLSNGYDTGLGDINIFDVFLLKSKGVKLGIGPLITMNSASQDELGSGKWQAGLSAVAVKDSTQGILGGLLQWQKSFAGDNDRIDVQTLTFQPFAFYNLPQGWYVRSSAVMTYNLENDDYYVPVGLGMGRAWKGHNKVFNAFIEPQWTVAHEGEGEPKFTLFAGLNITFMQ